MVYMVNKHAWRGANNFSMHSYLQRLAIDRNITSCIKMLAATAAAPEYPLVFSYSFIVGIIDTSEMLQAYRNQPLSVARARGGLGHGCHGSPNARWRSFRRRASSTL